MQSPVELPTERYSLKKPDPEWTLGLLPVAQAQHPVEKELSPYSTTSFPAFSNHAVSSPDHLHPYSTSSPATDSVPATTEIIITPSHEHDPHASPFPPLPPSPAKFELPAGRPTSEFFQHKPVVVRLKEDIKDESTDTEGTTESSTDHSTVGTASLLEEQPYAIREHHLPAKDISQTDNVAITLPQLPLSTQSSFSSLQQTTTPTPTLPAVPTSKYSSKPASSRNYKSHSSSRTSLALPIPDEQAQTARPSLGRGSSVPPVPREQTQTQMQRPQTSYLADIPVQKQSIVLAKSPLSITIQASKSTASQRRQRALNSHPSNNSLTSRRHSSSSDQDVRVARALAPQPRSRPSSRRTEKSTDSRGNRNSSYTALAPTPAPTTPLPQLPPHALTSDSESDAMPTTPQAAHIPVERECRPRLRVDHSQLASFMITNQTMIFRRFDDIHVQLLLCLQDEISDLERKLNETDGADMTHTDRRTDRIQVLRDLRRVVGEYDQLFAAWSSMQATKAPKSTLASLKQWLQRPEISAGAGLGHGAQEDLLWLDGAKDLSSVKPGTNIREKVYIDRRGSPGSAVPTSRKPGRFASCVGRRK